MICRPIDALLMALESVKDFRPYRFIMALWWRGDDAFQVEREGRIETRMSRVTWLRLQKLIANTRARPGYFEDWTGPVGLLGTELYEEDTPPADLFLAMLGKPEMLQSVDPAKCHPWVRDILPELAARKTTDGKP